MGPTKSTSKAKKTNLKAFYLIVRDNEWHMTCETFEEAKDSAKDDDTILEVSASWEVSSKLNFRKEAVSEYI